MRLRARPVWAVHLLKWQCASLNRAGPRPAAAARHSLSLSRRRECLVGKIAIETLGTRLLLVAPTASTQFNKQHRAHSRAASSLRETAAKPHSEPIRKTECCLSFV